MSGTVGWSDEVTAYLDSLQRGDRAAAIDQVRTLRTGGCDVLSLIHGLLAPAQLRVGELWLAGRWSIAQEHAATAISEAVLSALATERESAATARPEAIPVIVSCVEQEWHALPALMVSEQLRSDGFDVTYLGANASATTLVRHVHETGPAAVLLSCSLSTYLPLVRRQVEAVRETGTPVVVGGSAFDPDGRRAAAVGANGFATSASGVADAVRSLPSTVPAAPPLAHAGAGEAFVVFRLRESLADQVRGALVAWVEADGDPRADRGWLDVLDDQLPHVVGSVAGALVTDDPSVVGQALTWARDVLVHRRAPSGSGDALSAGLRGALVELPAALRVVDLALAAG